LSANSFVAIILEGKDTDPSTQHVFGRADTIAGLKAVGEVAPSVRSSPFLVTKQLSPWSRSGAKRLFDCACVLSALPLLVPVFLVIALAVWLTSSGPVLFTQKRVGRHGQTFTILKFRTMIVATDKAHHAITTVGNQRFTSIGRFLRQWKLDELPQLLNVLAGHMSIIGPRPLIPEHMIVDLPCRPGISGAATIAFAREEAILDRVPKQQLESYYYTIVLPAKRRIDAEYMARATFLSDLRLIVNSALRRWDSSVMESLHDEGSFAPFAANDFRQRPSEFASKASVSHKPILPNADQPASAEQVASF